MKFNLVPKLPQNYKLVPKLNLSLLRSKCILSLPRIINFNTETIDCKTIDCETVAKLLE